MSKKPIIETLDVGYSEKYKLNKNFAEITSKFDEMLSRTTPTDTPNFMEVDFDVADANITNVNRLEIESLQIVDTNFTQFSDYYIYLLSLLDCDTEGSMITHDENGDPVCLDVGTNGQVLKTISAYPTWGTDIDTDTVGVTVQEDGVTIAENVTTIDFKWSQSVLVTTPSADQVDLALDEALAAVLAVARFEDFSQIGDAEFTNFGYNPGTVRLDLAALNAGNPVASDNDFYAVMEGSFYWQYAGGGGAAGATVFTMTFYDNTGTATFGTGNTINAPAGETRSRTYSNASYNGLVGNVVCGVPAGTAYIDWSWSILATIPIAIDYFDTSDHYRGVFRGVARDDIETPAGYTYASQGFHFPTLTPGP